MRTVWASWAGSRLLFGVGLLVVHAAVPSALPTDVAVVYFHAARDLAHGAVPYLDFNYEYPPGSLPVLALAWLLGGRTPFSFVLVWALCMLAVDALIVRCLTSSRFGRHAAFVWVFGIALLGPTALLRNDLLVVAAFVAAFVLTAGRGNARGGAVWTLGVLIKLWPIAPLAALVMLPRRGRARLTVGAASVAVASAALLVTVGAWTPMTRSLLSYQGHRPVEIESLWAMPTWLASLASGRHVAVTYGFGSFNLAGGHLAGAIATAASTAAMLGCALVPVLTTVLTRRPVTRGLLAWTFAAYVSVALVVAPVLSPQYLLWLLGAGAVLLGVVGRGEAGRYVTAVLVSCALTQLVFPVFFTGLQHGAATAIVALAARNAALLAAMILAFLGVRNATTQTAGSTPNRTPGRSPAGR